MDAALLSAALACFRNFVRHAVVEMVNAEYATMVVAVIAAKDEPYCHDCLELALSIDSLHLSTYQYTAHETYLESSRDDMKDHACEQETDTFGSSINCSCKAASLSSEVKIEIKPKQMSVDSTCDFTNSFLCD